MQTDMTVVQLQADYLNQLKHKLLSHPQWRAVQSICSTLTSQGFQCCLVGGSVRDYLLNLTPGDLDLVTDATPEQIRPLFDRTLEMGVRFGVSQIVLNEDVIDLATFRSEDQYFDGRHPERILFSTMAEDFKRRDFTINSLYLDLKTWELHDFCHAFSDLQQKILRTIGDAEKRFLEDHLRIFRALRFATRFELTIEPKTLQAIKTSAHLTQKLSKHRLTEEAKKSFQLDLRLNYLELLDQLGLWSMLFQNVPYESLEITDPQIRHLIQKTTWVAFLAALYFKFSRTATARLTRDQKLKEIEAFFPSLLLLKQEKKAILHILEGGFETQRQDPRIFREILAMTQI